MPTSLFMKDNDSNKCPSNLEFLWYFFFLRVILFKIISRFLSPEQKKNVSMLPMSVSTVFDLITAHTPISAQSRNSTVFRLQPVYFFLYFFTKAYVVGTHLNCIDKSMQFKWVPTTYAFLKKVRINRIVIINKSFSDLFYSVALVDRYIFDHKWVFPVSLKYLSAQCGN